MLGYFLLFLFVLFVAEFSKNYKKTALFSVFIFLSLFVGLRYDVGTDYENYVDIYNTDVSWLEGGFRFFAEWLYDRNLDVTYMFLGIAVVTYGFMFGGLYFMKEANLQLSIIMLSLFTLSFTCNGIRQALAVSIFLFSYQFIKNRKILPYVLCVFLATFFHASAVLLFPLYFFVHKDLPKKIYVIIYLLSFAFIFMNLETLTSPFSFFLSHEERYLHYVENRGTDSGYFSIGVLAQILVYFVLFVYALNVQFEKRHTILFNLFLLCCIFMNMRVGAPLFIRVQAYFNIFTNIIIPIVVLEQKSRNERLLLALFFSISLCIMTASYFFFSPQSRMYPYHDVLGIF